MARPIKNSNLSATYRKVEQEINFLQERLKLMQKQSNPNSTMLETYSTMLESRLSVREQLLEQYSSLKELDYAAG